MTTATQTLTPTLSEDALHLLEDRTAHALEETARLERLLSQLGQRTAGSTSMDAKLAKSLAMAKRAVGFTRAALEDMAAALPNQADDAEPLVRMRANS